MYPGLDFWGRNYHEMCKRERPLCRAHKDHVMVFDIACVPANGKTPVWMRHIYGINFNVPARQLPQRLYMARNPRFQRLHNP